MWTTVELRDYLRIARRGWLLILGTVIVCVVLTAIITAQITPRYASTARVFISTARADSSQAYQGGLFSEERVTSYADVVVGLGLAQRVIDQLGLDLTAPELSDKVEATFVPATVVLKITVTDSSPGRAQRINNGVVKALQDVVGELETPPGSKVPALEATVVDSPGLPEEPVSPNPLRNISLAVILGSLLGIGLAILREVLDATVRRLEDVPGLEATPLLSTLPFDNEVQERPLITDLPLHAPRGEAFRVLRTNLSFINVDTPAKAFVVTSSVPGEGKSTIATNAAIAMATAGQKVLLIDADLRRPQVAKLLALEPSVGLTTVLVGMQGLEESIQQHAQSGLSVLTSGRLPPNPAELLQTEAMRSLVDTVRSRYDVTIIDAPPLLPVTDAAVMAGLTDGAVLVVHYGTTTRDQLTGAVERLRAVGAAPVGAIFNMVPVRGSSARYGDGHGYGHGYRPVAAQHPTTDESLASDRAADSRPRAQRP